jgi:hypothetical protein
VNRRVLGGLDESDGDPSWGSPAFACPPKYGRHRATAGGRQKVPTPLSSTQSSDRDCQGVPTHAKEKTKPRCFELGRTRGYPSEAQNKTPSHTNRPRGECTGWAPSPQRKYTSRSKEKVDPLWELGGRVCPLTTHVFTAKKLRAALLATKNGSWETFKILFELRIRCGK